MASSLPTIAGRSKQLRVAVLVCSTKRERHDVVEFVLQPKRETATGAPALLQFE
jgi:hypothetical protein